MSDRLPRQPRRRCARWCSPTACTATSTSTTTCSSLEQQHFFANTWNYVGHDRRSRTPATTCTVEIAGRPLIVVRHTDGSVRVLMNRCAHKGSRARQRAVRQHRQFFRCPYHAWTYRTDGSLLNMPLKNGYDGTALHECESAKGLVRSHNVRLHRGFVFAKINDAGPDFEEFFGASLSSIDNMADRSPEGELEIAGGCLRFMHQCNWKMFVENLNDTMHPMVVHESSAGTAKRMWIDKPADAAQADGDRAVHALHVGLQVLRGHGRARVRQRPQLLGRALQHPQQVLGDPGLRRGDEGGLRRRAHRADPRPGAPQHRLLPEPDDQGRDPVDPRRQADRGRQDADRELDLPPDGRAAGAAAAHRRCTTA